MPVAVKQFLQNHRIEIVIFFISFLAHLAASIFLYHKFGNQVLYFENEDAHSYINLAQSIAAGQGFARDGVPSAVRTPVYPLFLAIFYFLRLPMPWIILLAQNIVASIAAVFLFRIGRMIFSQRVGIMAGVIYAIEPYMLMTANLATTETLFNAIIIASIYSFVHWWQCRASRNVVYTALFFGLATLTRPVALYGPAVFLSLMAVVAVCEKRYRRTIMQIALFLIVFVMSLSPWLIRQYTHYHRWKITNIDAVMFYGRIAPIVVSYEQGISYNDAIQLLNKQLHGAVAENKGEDANVYNNFFYYDFMMRTTKTLVARHPGIVARYYALSLIPALTGTGYEYMLEDVFGLHRANTRPNFTGLLFHGNISRYWQAIIQLDVFQSTLLLGAGTWALCYLLIFFTLCRKVVWRRHWLPLLLCLTFAGYFIFFTLGPAVHARYRMPSFPFWFLLISFSFDFWLREKYGSSFSGHTSVQ